MIKNLMREVILAVQAKTGLTPGFVISLGFAAIALLTSFAFFCVALYDWIARFLGSVFSGLIVAGFFLFGAAFFGLISLSIRRAAKQQAILERAAHSHGGSWLFDPKIVSAAVQLGRSLGWQRLVPVALLGIIAAQWARDYRDRRQDDDVQGEG